jgi:acetamidase/formamidase
VPHHVLEPEAGLVVDAYTADVPPALEIASGDRLTVRTLDANGSLRPWRALDQERHEMFPEGRGHCLAGPISVTGAQRGQFLAVELHSLRPADDGFTIAGTHDNWLNRHLGVHDAEPGFSSWRIDADAGTATDQHGRSVPVAPFLGVLGTAPDEPGEHSTIPPRTRCGGNIDCRDLVAGSTVYLPVNVPGGYLFLGDGHAAQGHGEVGGTAIECGMTTDLTVTVVDDRPIDAVHALAPNGRITFGFDEDLDVAAGDALAEMLTWMQQLLGLSRPDALALAGVTVDLHITQIVNRTWGAHATLPYSVAARQAGSESNELP